jgi:multicomponent Na+:H+ antiporter subunit E
MEARIMRFLLSIIGGKPPDGWISLWLLLTFVWIAANSSLAVENVATGVLISGILSYLFARNTSIWSGLRLTPSRIYHFALYTGVFVVELVRANLNMMRYVYSPRINIRPGIVKVSIGLKSRIGRLALANSIALTPGSLVVDIDDDALFIHWLDVKTTDRAEATRIIAGPFAEHLEKTFG